MRCAQQHFRQVGLTLSAAMWCMIFKTQRCMESQRQPLITWKPER